jgi:hypothetical protein
VLIECAAVCVEIARQVAARRRAEAGIAARARPAIEGIEPRRVEGQRLAWRERVARQRPLARADGSRADVGGERGVAAKDRELGFVFAASVRDGHAVFTGAIGRCGGWRRIDLIPNRVPRIVDARDVQQDASRGHADQGAILQFDGRELVDRERCAVGEQHLDASARRLQSIAGDPWHP